MAKFRKITAFILVLVMALSLGGISALAVAPSQSDIDTQTANQVVGAGGTNYYHANGTSADSSDYDVSISKTLSATGTENLFNVGVNVTFKNATTTVQGSDAAVVLVIDTSGSMNTADAGNGVTRLDAAKAAAESFLASYATVSNANTKRYVSIVNFDSNAAAHKITGADYWVDVAHIDGVSDNDFNSAEGKISGLNVSNNKNDRGTNTEGGMQIAYNLLRSSALTSTGISNKFVIFLTDGEPTFHLDGTNSTTAMSFDGTIGGGYYAQPADYQDLKGIADGITGASGGDAAMYSILYGDAAGTKLYIVNPHYHDYQYNGNWWDMYIEGSQTVLGLFQTFNARPATGNILTASSASDLSSIFNAILNQTVSSGSTLSAVVDAMAETDATAFGIDFVEFINQNGATDNGDGTISWNPVTADPTPPAGYTSYSMSYQVRLDNTRSGFVAGQAYSLGAATVTFNDVSVTPAVSHTVTSQIPQVKGYLGSLNFCKVDAANTNTGLSGAQFGLYSGAYDPADPAANRIKVASSAADGSVDFTGIPSGGSYTLAENSAPADFLRNEATSAVSVSYGVVSVSGSLLANGKVTDARDPKNETFTVNKTWLPIGTSGETVTADIYRINAANETVGSPVATLTISAPTWSASTSLPTVDVTTGDAINYTVIERATSANYRQVGGAGKVGNTFTLTNVSAATREITVSKAWVAPESAKTEVVIRLLQNGNTYQDFTFNASAGWSATVSVPTYDDNGTAYTYSVAEVVNGELKTTGAVTLGGNSFNVSVSGLTVTNTIAQDTTGVSGSKTWNIAAYDGTPAATITLYADNNPVDTTTVTASATTYSFSSLPKYALSGATVGGNALGTDGHEVVYTVAETATGDTAIVGSQNGNDFTNTLTGTRDITVTKVWDDSNNEFGTRPDSVTLVLSGNGQTYSHTFEPILVPAVADDPDTPEDESAAAYYTWDGADLSYTFTGLPKYNASGAEITYTVSEQGAVSGTIAGKDGTYYAVGINGFTVTNTLNGGETSVTVVKSWVDDKTDNTRAASTTITVSGSDGQTYPFTTSANGSQDFTVPLYKDGALITYTASETAVDGYNGGAAATPVRDGNTFTFTNTIDQAYVDVSVTKTWVDGSSDYRPSLTFNLKDGSTVVATKYGTDLADNGGVLGLSFTGLPKYDFSNGGCRVISYTVEETMGGVLAARYSSSLSVVEGVFNFTNTFNPGATEVSGTKTWIAGGFSEQVKVGLFVGDTMITSQTTSGLQYSFTGLDAYNADGSAIQYYVRELDAGDSPIANGDFYEVNGVNYTVTYSGGNITNTLPQAGVSLTVTKVWYGPMAQSVTFDVTRSANGEQDAQYSQSITLTAADATQEGGSTWSGSLTEQDKYDADRNTYTYDVTEHGASGGSVTLDGRDYTVAEETDEGNVNNFIFTNTIVDPHDGTFSVLKNWAGEGAVPEDVNVQLYADGMAVEGKSATLSGSGDPAWQHTFTGLPVYNVNHEAIVYSVKEVGVENGTIRLNGGNDLYAVSYNYEPYGGDYDEEITNTWQSTDTYEYIIYRHYTKTIDGVVTTYDENSGWTSGVKDEDVPVNASDWVAYDGTTYSFAGGTVNGSPVSDPSFTVKLVKYQDGENKYQIYLNYTYTYNTPYNPPVNPTYNTLTVHWVDDQGNALPGADPETKTYVTGASYNANDVSGGSGRTFTGYTYSTSSGAPVIGNMNGDKDVTFIYNTVITPESPPQTSIPDEPTGLDDSPKTGDNSMIALLWLTFCASFCGLVVLGMTIPKKKREDR